MSLDLWRFPEQGEQSPLQAWDAADEYLLNHLFETRLANVSDSKDMRKESILIINDEFGALTTALHEYSPLMCSDSFMSHTAARYNADRNALHTPVIIDCLALADLKLDSEFKHRLPFTLVLIKIPRTMALLEQQLNALAGLIDVNTQIIAAAKVKAVTSNVLKLFSNTIGETKTSLAVKKARLIFSQVSPDFGKNTFAPEHFINKVDDPLLPFSLYNHANTFCREHLDIGARLLLQHLPKNISGTCIDLGCGNGVLGTTLLQHNKELKVCFVDESSMALASAQLTAEKATSEDVVSERADFVLSHCLQTLLDNRYPKADLIVCNPPFHQLNVITDQIAWQMFLDAKRMLKPGGELRVVANRHLEYIPKIKRLFGECELIASNKKFVVLSAHKT